MKKAITTILAGILFSMPAYADSQTNMGQMLAAVGGDLWGPIILLLWSGSMLVGVYLVASALYKMVQSVGRDDMPVREVIMRMVGGGLLVGFWDTIQMGPMTMWNSTMTALGWSWQPQAAGAVTDCTGTGGGITCMAGNFASNVVPVFLSFLWIMAFLWGAWLIVSAVHAMATQHERSGSQVKPFPRIIIGFILCQLPLFISSVSATMGYATPVITGAGFSATNNTMLSYTAPTNWGLLSNYAELVGKIFIIMAMFGVIAVWKGIQYLKADAEGVQRGVVGAGLTHIIGGAMLINSKATTCFVMNTILGTGLNFCT